MTRTSSLRLVPLSAVLAVLVACANDGAGAAALTGPSDRASAGSGTDGTNGGNGTTATLRIRCERRSNRSRISVDGNNLRPAGAIFTAVVRSGAHAATAGPQSALGDEVEFDFDSAPDDVAAGATRIAPDFIVGGSVAAQLLRDGAVVASGTAACETR